MKQQYINFDVKRMHIFGELVKRYWNGEIKNAADLETLAYEIRDEYGFKDSEMPFIKDHIRIAMGLNPKVNEVFDDELDIVRRSETISPPVIAKVEGPCEHCNEDDCKCMLEVGKYETEMYKRNKGPIIVSDKCLSCGYCVSDCDFGALADKIEFMPIIDLLKDKKTPVYATVAPAIVGQFGEKVTMGKLRTALKMLGFEDMIETALFADILTIKEAFEFNHLVKSEEDFFLTSCCCPVWFNMIKKNYTDIDKHMSPSVSPMIASGRILKRLYQDAKVVFIAPCIAKKAEIKEPDLEGAIDYVLNFRELDQIFNALNIDMEKLQADEKDQASMGGRLYARSGGVSFSVKTVVNRLEPSRVIKLKALKVNGVQDCKKVLEKLRNGEKVDANFIEGMACAGGCVGGPRTNRDADTATKFVNEFGEDSFILTPFDNLNVMKILEQFNIDSIEEITKNDEIMKILSRPK
jgi:iron only hydrogenase large subunit-like protein